MNSTVKVFLPIAAVMGLVFGVTYLMQHVTPDPDDGKTGRTKGAEAAGAEPPLRFASAVVTHEPIEVGRDGAARFWFENRNPNPVVLQLKHVSCSACSRGRVTALPPEAVRLLLQMTALGTLPAGPVSPLPLGLAAPLAGMNSAALPGTGYKFSDHPDATFTIPAAPPADPAAADRWAAVPNWGVLELGFTARPPAEPRTLSSTFAAAVKNSPAQVGEFKFEIQFLVSAPFELSASQIDAGELTDSTPPRTTEVVAFSLTRSPAEMPPPNVQVRVPLGHPPLAGPDKCVTASAPELMTPDQVAKWADALGRPGFRPKSAYRFGVTVARQAGGTQLDIGALDREVWVSVGPAEGDQKKVAVKGSVRGGVWLAKGTALDMGTFPGKAGATERFELNTEAAAADLALAASETRPDFLQVTLKKLADAGDRGIYQVQVTVPPNRQFGDIRDGSVMLELKGGGPAPQRIRLPVKGRGNLN